MRQTEIGKSRMQLWTEGGIRIVTACLYWCCVAVALLGASSAVAQSNLTNVLNNTARSGSLTFNGTTSTINYSGNNTDERRVGTSGTANTGLVNIYFYQLPEASLLSNDVSVEYSFSRLQAGNVPAFNVDVYGLGFVSGATPSINPAWFHGAATEDLRNRADLGTGTTGTVTRLVDDLLIPTSLVGRHETGPSSSLKTYLQSLYANGAQAGDWAVIRLSADATVTAGPPAYGYEIGISANSNRPYNPSVMRFGPLPEVADSFYSGTDLADHVIDATYKTGYGFAGPWSSPTNPLAANAKIGRPNKYMQPEPVAVTTAMGTFDGASSTARFTGDFGFFNTPIRRELATPVTQDVYFRYILRVEKLDTNNGFDSNDLLGLWLDNSPGTDETDHSQTGVMLGIRNGTEVFGSVNGTTTAVATTINNLQDYLFIGRLHESTPGSGLNKLDFWVNPDSANQAPLGTVTFAGTGLSNISYVGLMTGPNTELTDQYLFDFFGLSTSPQRIGFITPATGLDGDFNHDNRVDGADYVVWRKGLGTTFNSNDYNTWRAHFGESMGAGSLGGGAVPEPSVIACLVAICAAGSRSLMRQRASSLRQNRPSKN